MAVKRIGSLLKFDAIEQPLNISCYVIGCHNKRGIKGVDVFARNRTFGMSNQRCNSDFRHPQIVHKYCQSVSPDLRGNTSKVITHGKKRNNGGYRNNVSESLYILT